MAVFKGFNTQVQFIDETAFGTGATPNIAIGGKVISFTPNWSNNMFREQGLGEGRDVTVH